MRSTERWAYFLIPLPDPVGLKNGHVFRSVESLEPVIDGAFGATEDRIITSVCIHQIESEIHERNASFAFFDLAKKIWPSQTEPLDPGETKALKGLTFARSVAEVAVTPIDEALRNHLDLDEHDDLYHQFEIALRSVNSLLDEYRMVAKIPVRLPTIELLPPFIPRAFGDVSVDTSDLPTNFETGIYLLSPHKILVPEEFTPEQSERLSSNLALSGLPHPLRTYSSVRNDAAIAQRLHGDHRMAIILIATSCEILINSVLQSLMWETGKALNSAAKTFHRSIPASKRVEKFSNYFGAAWAPKTTPELVRWDEDVARVRNRVVHSGTQPDRNEVDHAWSALDGLLALLKQCLEDRMQQYPRTLSWLIGDNLQELSSAAKDKLLDYRAQPEPNWLKLIDNWSSALAARNERSSPSAPTGPPRLVLYEDFSVGWIAADASKAHSSFVDPEQIRDLSDDFTDNLRESLSNLQDKYPYGLPEPIVIAVEGIRLSDSFSPAWRPSHEIDPMLSFSLEKNEIARPPTGFNQKLI